MTRVNALDAVDRVMATWFKNPPAPVSLDRSRRQVTHLTAQLTSFAKKWNENRGDESGETSILEEEMGAFGKALKDKYAHLFKREDKETPRARKRVPGREGSLVSVSTSSVAIKSEGSGSSGNSGSNGSRSGKDSDGTSIGRF